MSDKRLPVKKKRTMSNSSPTILNVNDDEAGRYAVTRTLQNAGFNVWEAVSGTEAVQFARRHPDLIVLDVQLPDISGFEVCRRLRSDPDTAPIAILHLSASFVNSRDKAYGLEGGADGYLTQPVEPPVLVAHIRALLRMRQAEEAAQEKAIQWQTTFDAISDCILLLDKAGRVLQCNQAMADLLHQPVAALQGQPLAPFSFLALDVAFLPPPDREVRQIKEVEIRGRWFQVTTDPIGSEREAGGSVHVMTDITQRKHAEKEIVRLLLETQEASVRQRAFMRDILSSVTEGKLTLCDSLADLPPPLPVAEKPLTLTHQTLSALRLAVRTVLKAECFSDERVEDLMTAVGEAAMNAIVHAGGGVGKIFTDTQACKVQVWVQDEGGGISVDRLPRATLQRGYTTAGTLGYGFKMMLQTADRVWLLTGAAGTTIVIEQQQHTPVSLLA